MTSQAKCESFIEDYVINSGQPMDDFDIEDAASELCDYMGANGLYDPEDVDQDVFADIVAGHAM